MSTESIVTEHHIDPESHDIEKCNDIYVAWMGCMLRNMAADILEIPTMGEPEADPDTVISRYRKYMKDAVNYLAGAVLCEKFMYGYISLERFCEEMVDEGLTEQMLTIPHLPTNLVAKYGSKSVSDSSIDNSVVDGNDSDDDDLELQYVKSKYWIKPSIPSSNGSGMVKGDMGTSCTQIPESETDSSSDTGDDDEPDMVALVMNKNLNDTVTKNENMFDEL